MDKEDIGLKNISGVDEPIYTPNTDEFEVTIKYKGRDVSRTIKYESEFDDIYDTKVVMINTVADKIQDNLEDMLESIII